MPKLPMDYLTEDGARVLAKRLRAYWWDHGYNVLPKVVPCHSGRGANINVIWTVDLPGFVNGMPPRTQRRGTC